MKNILMLFLVAVFFEFSGVSTSFAEQVESTQTQIQTQCGYVQTYGNYLSTQRKNPHLFEMWKEAHPGCYPDTPPSTGAQPIFDALDGGFDVLYEAVSGVAANLFAGFAFLFLVIAGVKIAFLGEDIKIAVGRAFLSLFVAYGAIEIGPVLLDHLLANFQKAGTQESALVFAQMKSIMLSSPTQSGVMSYIQSYIPSGGSLDPVKVMTLGVQSGIQVYYDYINSFLNKGWIQTIETFPVFIGSLVWAFLDAAVQGIGFLILGLDLAFLTLEGKVLIAMSPLAFSMLALRSFHDNTAYRTIIDKVIGLSVKIYVFYVAIFVALAVHAELIGRSAITIVGVPANALNFMIDILITIFSTVLVIYVVRISGSIFNHSSGLIASAITGSAIGTAASMAGKAALVAATGGTGAAAVGAGAALKQGLSKGDPGVASRKDGFASNSASKDRTNADLSKGAFSGEAQKIHQQTQTQQTQDTRNPDNVPSVNFPAGTILDASGTPYPSTQQQTVVEQQSHQTKDVGQQNVQQQQKPAPTLTKDQQNKNDKK